MFLDKSLFKPLKPLLTALTIATCTVGGVQTIAFAQGTPGLVLFGNRDVDVLNYYLDFGGIADNRDRYRFRIPKKKLQNGVTRLVISYPDYFDGKFNTDKIEVRPNREKKESLPLKATWDEENRLVQIVLDTPLKDPKELEIVLSDTKNPDVGTYYFFAQVHPATGTPVPEQIGAWVVNINP